MGARKLRLRFQGDWRASRKVEVEVRAKRLRFTPYVLRGNYGLFFFVLPFVLPQCRFYVNLSVLLFLNAASELLQTK